MTNKEIGNRIKDTRKQLGKTLEDIASEIGVARSTIQRYEAGKIENLKLPVLSAIADALGVNDAWLIGKSDEMRLTDVARFERYAEGINRYRAENEYGKTVAIPVVRRVAAGLPLTSFETTIGYEPLTENTAKTGTYFALQISGDSMSPNIADGDIVICRQQEDAEDGQIVVALVNGDDGCCKRLRKYPDGTIALLSDNTAYKPMYFSTSEIDNTPVKIMGIVKELRRKF